MTLQFIFASWESKTIKRMVIMGTERELPVELDFSRGYAKKLALSVQHA